MALNILHVIPGLGTKSGGPQMALKGFAIAQRRVGADVGIICSWSDESDRDMQADFIDGGVRVDAIGPTNGPFRWPPHLSRKLADRVATADIVHIHGLWDPILHHAAVAARRHKKPYIFVPHGMLDPWSLRQKALKKKLYLELRLRRDLNAAAAIHYITATERFNADRMRLQPATIVEPIGLDFGEFDHAPPKGSFRAEFPDLAGKSVVLFLGRLHYGKGLDLLIQVIARLPSDVHLVLAGPDSAGYRGELEQIIRETDVTGRVSFVGMLTGPDRVAALQDADVFVLPSQQENFGIAVIEAMAAGTPVVISDKVGIAPEVLLAQAGAVTPLDVAAIRQELVRLLDDTELRRSAGKRGAEYVRLHFQWPQIANRWTMHYQRLIDHG